MSELVNKAKKHCKSIFKKSRCSNLPFHSLMHTMEVYNNVIKLGAYEKCDIDSLESVIIAALFHDTGHAFTFIGHEEVSSTYAILFLEKNGVCDDKIKRVCDYILATKLPQKPKDDFERIICDADLFHLGSKSFFNRTQLLRNEWSEHLKIDYSDEAWNILNIRFLQEHQFHSKYGKEILEPIKKQNIELLQQSQESF